MEACVSAHHLSRTLTALGHDVRLMPAKYVRPYSECEIGGDDDRSALVEPADEM
jgi:transposase